MTKPTRERDIDIGEQSARPSTMIFLHSPLVPEGGDESPPLDCARVVVWLRGHLLASAYRNH